MERASGFPPCDNFQARRRRGVSEDADADDDDAADAGAGAGARAGPPALPMAPPVTVMAVTSQRVPCGDAMCCDEH